MATLIIHTNLKSNIHRFACTIAQTGLTDSIYTKERKQMNIILPVWLNIGIVISKLASTLVPTLQRTI